MGANGLDRAEGALLVAEQALEEAREAKALLDSSIAETQKVIVGLRADCEKMVAKMGELATEIAKTSKEILDVAVGAITETKAVAEDVEVLKSAPKAPASFFIDDAGELIAVYPGGATKTIGMVRGKDGLAGAKGLDGRDGRDAKDGRDGAPGKDALEAKILRNLDETRSYPAGTYAVHEGAFIQAKRATGPISDGLEAAGWEVLNEYPSIVSMGFAEDSRTFTVVARTASGKRLEEIVKLPVIIDRGVWKGGTYERGDAVTRDGSLWIAQCATEAMPGGASPDWRLAVKRGRDGK